MKYEYILVSESGAGNHINDELTKETLPVILNRLGAEGFRVVHRSSYYESEQVTVWPSYLLERTVAPSE